MSQLDVRIVRLDPMRVISVHGFGPEPEGVAWRKLWAWVERSGAARDGETQRVFGLNNPNPSAGSPNYGYEFWIEVGPDVQGDGDAQVKEFGGGLYAVTRCHNLSQIGDVWHRLALWRENSPHRGGHHQWLEQHIGPLAAEQTPEELVLDLFLPIV